MHEIATWVFWCSIVAIGFAYAVYPILIWGISHLFAAPHTVPSKVELPMVSLLVAAHNEESCIAARIQNALAADYPLDKLEVLIASDGSTDQTNEILGRFNQPNVRLLDYPRRRGKSATLNASIEEARGEIVVFSDANSYFEPSAISNLVRWFADPHVGVVCGKLVLTDSTTGRNVDGLYWRYETFLKQCEGRLGGLLGANGAIYAMRRRLYCPIPDNTIIDDFVIPLVAKTKHRFRILYDSSAIAHEETAASIKQEFHRRVRIGTGDYQSLVTLWPLLMPRHGWTSLTFLSHKLLRWLSPFMLIAAFISNLLLVAQPHYSFLLVLQISFYVLAFAGIWVAGDGLLAKAQRGASLFCGVNLALFLGFFRWVTISQSGIWQRTERDVQQIDLHVAPLRIHADQLSARENESG